MGDVFERVRAANPIVDVEAYADHIAGVNGDQSVVDIGGEAMNERIEPERPTKRVWQVAAVLVVVAALGVGGLLVTLDSGDADATDGSTTRTPLDTVELWLDAWRNGDPDGFHSLISADAEANVGRLPRTVAYFDGALAVDDQAARNSKLAYVSQGTVDAECAAAGPAVDCVLTHSGPFVAQSPDGRSDRFVQDVSFVVADGLIVEMTDVEMFARNIFDTTAIAEYGVWLAERDPAAYEALFFLGTMLVDDREQVEQHRSFVAEWAETAG